MKKVILIVIVISVIIAGGVLFAGLLNDQEDSTNTNSSPGTNTPSSDEVSQEQSATGSFTTTEVSQHSSQEDCWIVIDNQVYDVTDFLTEHPGGIERITPFCGQDATEAFATQGGEGTHSATATQLREDFLIGSLAE